MNILIPVDPDRRLPALIKDPDGFLEFSGTVVVKYVNPKLSPDFSALSFAYYNHRDKCWENALPEDFGFKNKNNKIVEWYEEAELESLLPDDDTSYRAASAAGNGSSFKIFLHQEGQTFLKNHLLKSIRK